MLKCADHIYRMNGGGSVFKKVSVIGNNHNYIITIHVKDEEIANKTDEEIADIIENKIRIEMNKLLYGKKGV